MLERTIKVVIDEYILNQTQLYCL